MERAIQHETLDDLVCAQRSTHLMESSDEETSEADEETSEAGDDGFFALDREWRFTYVNRAAERILDRPRAELLGACFWDLYPAALGTALEDRYREAIEEDREVAFEARSARNDVWHEVRVVPLPTGLSVYFRDVTVDYYARMALDQILTSRVCILWHATVQDLGYGVLKWETRVANEEAAQQYLPLNLAPFERYVDAWNRARLPEDRVRIDAAAMAALFSGETGYRQDFRCIRRDGALRWLTEEAQITRLAPDMWHLIGVCVDVTEYKRVEQELAHANEHLRALATTDGLTGLNNHRAFHERLAIEFARAWRNGTGLSLLLFDVDRFKAYNDRFGHPAGDEVLKQVARLATVTARLSDVAARYGGEEFAVILPGTDVAESRDIAERLRQAIADYPWTHAKVTVSVGIVTLRTDHEKPAALIDEADAALYLAKGLGRNRVLHHRFIADEFADKPIVWEV